MSCCGKMRTVLGDRNDKNSDGAMDAPRVDLTFSGVRAIVVTGGVTGHVYRFVPGATLRVHGGDAASMRQIPGLRPKSSSVSLTSTGLEIGNPAV